MALNLEQKKAITKDLSASVDTATAVVAADYRGLTSSDMTELRAKARGMAVNLKIARNTLVKRAFNGTMYSCMEDSLTGPTMLAISEEPSAGARLLRDFSKDHEQLVVKSLCVEGQLYSAKDLVAVASLPTKDEAIAKLLSVMQAPIVKFVRTLREPHAKLVRVFAAVRDQKQASGS